MEINTTLYMKVREEGGKVIKEKEDPVEVLFTYKWKKN